jgi:hypothetical protein
MFTQKPVHLLLQPKAKKIPISLWINKAGILNIIYIWHTHMYYNTVLLEHLKTMQD